MSRRCCSDYRRDMLERTRLPTGYFDTSYYMYFEDVDLGWRCRLAGWRAYYVPGAVVGHAFQASSRRRGRHFVTIQCMQNRVRTLLNAELAAGTHPLIWDGLDRNGNAVASGIYLIRAESRGQTSTKRAVLVR